MQNHPCRLILTMIKKLHTIIVRTAPITSIGYQGPASLCSLIRCLITQETFIQKASAGPAIKSVDRNNDDTSGPKINLPPNKNFWKHLTAQNEGKRHGTERSEIMQTLYCKILLL